MDAFLKTLQTLPEVAELVSRVENGGCPAVLTGTQPVQRACVCLLYTSPSPRDTR